MRIPVLRCVACLVAMTLFLPSIRAELPTNTVPGTKQLTLDEPLDEAMVAGIDRFALRELVASPSRRPEKWSRDYSSVEKYLASVAANRERFQTIIGAVDERVAGPGFELVATTEQDSVIAETDRYTVHAVRWQVLEGITGEGLLFEPREPPKARVVAIPDADWSPELFAGLTEGKIESTPIPRLLAERGCQVLVPVIISRDSRLSGDPRVRYTNQTHREFIYRMAFEMGRHIIGYEIQRVLAGVDVFERLAKANGEDVPIGVCGVGEGGLLALYAAALDPRIDAAWVAGYFQQREAVWSEPIYRNVWSLLTEFGDAEIASLVAPRRLLIEASSVKTIPGPPAPKQGQRDTAAPGSIRTPEIDSVKREFARAHTFYDKLGVADRLQPVTYEDDAHPAGGRKALEQFAKWLKLPSAETGGDLDANLTKIDAKAREKRQFDELVAFTQELLEASARKRDAFWSKADRSSIEAWKKSAQWYRDYVYDEMIGRLPEPAMPLNPRTRQVIDEPTHRGFEVVLDVYPDVIAGGILLLPKDLEEGERRPVVVCQHGLEGTPMDTITTDRSQRAWRAYKGFTTQLVRRGFIVYAPQNPYRGYHKFRTLQRKSNPMKRSLFSYIIRQHERTLEWLESLPWVNGERIGFYGLSYGGKTAVRVPPMLEKYALSICSADFNEWVRKNVTNRARYSYIFTIEYEMFEWNMGHVANYAELSSLMVPRPFMVERGHDDGVAPDEWVAWEYAKVRRHYDKLGIGERTEIEFFNGPHTINGKGTFEFLHRHLEWPEPRER